MAVGDRHQFSFNHKEFTVREELNDTNINLWWAWKNELCPHCKKVIEKRTLYTFTTIAILAPINKANEVLTREDIVIKGQTQDRREMLFPIDKYDEVFSASSLFKSLIEGKQ